MTTRQKKRKYPINIESNHSNDIKNGPWSSHTSKKPYILLDNKLNSFKTNNLKTPDMKRETMRLEAGKKHQYSSLSLSLETSLSLSRILDESYARVMDQYNQEMRSSNGIIQPTVIHLRLSESQTNPFLQRHIQCLYTPQKKRPAKMSRGIQTIYRESSMQTLPYLPDVLNDEKILKTLELFKLPKILPGDGPPGLREVEILERARKRWAFEEAVKKKFQQAMKSANSEAERKKLIPQHKEILEAFEWEQWLQREELIQGCQMMRFQLVLGIFEKREREMHTKAASRIQNCCKEIIQRRDQALKKNEIEFGREMRRLKNKHEKKPRHWRKEKISDQLGDPSSEFYAPQMRYGVNPNRRHFQLSRKAFEMRMEDIGKRAVDMKNLECPFAKLKEWAKPKVPVLQVEPNFCSEVNLKKLYEGLKNLREDSKKQKVVPKCLVEKQKKLPIVYETKSEDFSIDELDLEPAEEYNIESEDEEVQVGSKYSQSSLLEMNSQRTNQNISINELLSERRREEIENMLAEYEGTQIGWLMRFLSEEECRLQEQRKLHFMTMLAQKERWRREAAEAGLRQKENEMRIIYEEIFNETNESNQDVGDRYLNNIFETDTKEEADFEAAASITELAKLIDIDLQRWLTSFELIQNPLNYDRLRCLLRDLVFPDEIAESLCQKIETRKIIDHILNDVLMKNVFELLEPYDISSSLANDLVDRLIDNDLYIFSSECSSTCDCQGECKCRPEKLEAKAILRKLIRYSVPGRRWKTPSERAAMEEELKALKENERNKLEESVPSHHPIQRYRTFTTVLSDINEMNSILSVDEGEFLSHSSSDNTYSGDVTVVKYHKSKFKGRKRSKQSFEGPKSSEYDTGDEYEGPMKARYLIRKDLILSLDNKMKSSNIERVPEPEPDVPEETFFLKEGFSYFNLNNFEIPIQTSSSEGEKSILQSQSPMERLVNDIIYEVIYNIEKTIFKTEIDQIESDKKRELVVTDVKSVVTISNLESESKTSESSVSETFIPEDFCYEASEEAERFSKPKKYQMVLYEGDLEKILYDDDDCKCQMEIDYQNHIRELYESGKILIIPKAKRPSESDQTAKDFELDHLDFEYEGSDVLVGIESEELIEKFEENEEKFVESQDIEDIEIENEALIEEFDIEQHQMSRIERNELDIPPEAMPLEKEEPEPVPAPVPVPVPDPDTQLSTIEEESPDK